jgi:DNA-binding MarR family transcriptional regulator
VHGRIRHVDLTKRGRELLATCRRRVHAIEAELTKGLPAGEEQAIKRWLVHVATTYAATS